MIHQPYPLSLPSHKTERISLRRMCCSSSGRVTRMMPWDDFWHYAWVFGALVMSAFGVPIPEEVPIITGGVLVGKEWDNPNSWMKWWIMLPVCIAGVVVCDMVLYVIGRKWGVKLLKKKWVQRHILSPEKR